MRRRDSIHSLVYGLIFFITICYLILIIFAVIRVSHRNQLRTIEELTSKEVQSEKLYLQSRVLFRETKKTLSCLRLL